MNKPGRFDSIGRIPPEMKKFSFPSAEPGDAARTRSPVPAAPPRPVTP